MPLAPTRPKTSDLDRIAAGVLDRRLERTSPRPLAVALSGGGDSVALLRLAADWARGAGRGLLVLTVDHGLQPESVGWTQACATRAAAVGADFRALSWTGQKPLRGLPAAARAARHALLADAAREAGAQVILMGHTADDILEARAMRAAGSTTPEPREWTPSPAWPEGRGVFLLRPLLGVRRAAIRDWLAAHDEAWIDDPANADLRSARARARQALDAAAFPPSPDLLSPDGAPAKGLAETCRMDAAGVLSVAREALRASGAEAFTAAACLCAAGTTRPPASDRIAGLVARLRSEGPVTATLAGARIEADDHEVRFLREPGEARRGGLAAMSLAAGETAVWDGRFEIAAAQALTVRALGGLAARLAKTQRAAIQGFAPKARAALPVTADGQPIAARPLALERLRAACGVVAREPA